MAIKWQHIIAVQFENETRYVSGFASGKKVAYWKDGEQAKPLSMTYAKDVVYGLLVNGYYAHIITTPACCLENYKNPGEKTEE